MPRVGQHTGFHTSFGTGPSPKVVVNNVRPDDNKTDTTSKAILICAARRQRDVGTRHVFRCVASRFRRTLVPCRPCGRGRVHGFRRHRDKWARNRRPGIRSTPSARGMRCKYRVHGYCRTMCFWRVKRTERVDTLHRSWWLAQWTIGHGAQRDRKDTVVKRVDRRNDERYSLPPKARKKRTRPRNLTIYIVPSTWARG